MKNFLVGFTQGLAFGIAAPFVVIGGLCLAFAWFIAADHRRYPRWGLWFRDVIERGEAS